MAFMQQRVFMRTGVEEEEITPPCMKSRSFDSLSVAHILQAKLDPTAAARAARAEGPSGAMVPPSPEGPGSPTMAAAAAVLHRVGQTEEPSHASVAMDSKAVDCLLSLAGGAGSAGASGKASGKRSLAAMGGASGGAAGSGTTRRRLKMRAGPAASKMRHPHPVAQASLEAPPMKKLLITGIPCPVSILSGATMLQLQLLAAAYKLCPSPTPEQLDAIARRVGVTSDKLQTWFASRRTLQDWVLQQPHLTSADLARMFYPGAAEAASTSASACPTPVPTPVPPAAPSPPLAAAASTPPVASTA